MTINARTVNRFALVGAWRTESLSLSVQPCAVPVSLGRHPLLPPCLTPHIPYGQLNTTTGRLFDVSAAASGDCLEAAEGHLSSDE